MPGGGRLTVGRAAGLIYMEQIYLEQTCDWLT
jgi:hypothetical protein